MKRIVISSDGTEACIYMPGLPNKRLYHSEGKVVELVLWFIMPNIPKSIPVGEIRQALLNSLEDTAEINLEAA